MDERACVDGNLVGTLPLRSVRMSTEATNVTVSVCIECEACPCASEARARHATLGHRVYARALGHRVYAYKCARTSLGGSRWAWRAALSWEGGKEHALYAPSACGVHRSHLRAKVKVKVKVEVMVAVRVRVRVRVGQN